MVAISLYRGNLHRVPNLPRQWLMPKPLISPKLFSSLLRRRSRALSRLRSSASSTITDTTTNPNLNLGQQEEEVVGDNGGCSNKQNQMQSNEATPCLQSQPVDLDKDNHGCSRDAQRESIQEVNDGEVQKELDESDPSGPEKPAAPEKDCGGREALREEEQLGSANPNSEINNNIEVLSDREKKKQELEQKLHVLNEKKHNLVLMLKQILNAEEEMKRRNSMQASVIRSPVPSQVEATNDLGANPRHATNRMGSEGNSSGDLEGESEDASNHNAHARHLQQMSPSASSPLRRPTHGSFQHNLVPHSTRPSLGTGGHNQTSTAVIGAIASPSRFALAGHQTQPSGLPPLATSGTPFTASSPSPAASGGTSVFRDARRTSPTWN